MGRLNSFFFPAEFWPSMVGDTAVCKGDEARHMLTVLRTGTEQTVRLFDGYGRDGLFRVKERKKNRALLEAIQLNTHPEPVAGLTLAIGWGKSKRRNYLFEKMVELKGAGVLFWQAKRSQGFMPENPKDTWQDKCIQAAKQCGNPYLPRLEVLSGGLAELQECADSYDHSFVAWESEIATTPLSPGHLASGRSLVVIGPEGGLEDDEANALIDSGFTPVTLGKSLLRWETAASYCLSLAWFAIQENQ